MEEQEVTIKKYAFHGVTSKINDIALLKGICSSFDDCRLLEIGTRRGETLYNASEVCKECVSISLPDEEVEKTQGKDVADIERSLTKGLENVSHIEHDSTTFDFSTIGKFDVVFIDGDHSYKAVLSDTINAFKTLRNENSIIIWHDFAYRFNNKQRYEVIEGALDGCPSRAHRERVYRVKNTICGVYSNKKLPGAEYIETKPKPDKLYDLNLKVHYSDSK